jgi:hypothetical protein
MIESITAITLATHNMSRRNSIGSTFVGCDNAGSYGPQRVGRLKDHRDRPIQSGRPRGEDLICDVVESAFLAHVTLSDEVVEFAQHGGARHPNRMRDFLCSHRCSGGVQVPWRALLRTVWPLMETYFGITAASGCDARTGAACRLAPRPQHLPTGSSSTSSSSAWPTSAWSMVIAMDHLWRSPS